ncbi:FAD-dependent monooxygenase [Streptomyces triticiradicis]|uniref:NAD(P)-binding protein n=1 Tax=Streptomyces triticiradicis TaxID=2651189 RepID=A0A7J5D1F6_9ACTN|nr:FAD-dependent monooxygenase [Streptomyces triticiradicis]KAB1973351.1 NAD(P)-binding protein [Streptomyces triticiradicis]
MVRWVRGQVVVVGGGPVGMLLACELAGRGVRVVVVESRAAVSGCPKASVLHARAVQCLVRRGYLAGLAGGGGVAPVGGAFHFAGIPGLVISAPSAEPEPVLRCSQEVLERHFEGRARAAGVRVLRGCRVVEVRQGAGGVRVVARGPGGTVVCTGGYLVGADGARSVVRRQAGFVSRTWPATVSAMAGDVRLGEGAVLEEGWHRTERGWVVVRHVGGGVVRLRTLDCRGAQVRRDLPLGLEELRREVGRITGGDVAMGEGRWLSRFSDFSRLALCYRRGRVLLAGDAAHVHFPVGGQGLSAGVLDAVNLGWKLALAVRGRAGASLLDSYDLERRPAARRVIDNTRAQLALMRPGPELDPLRALFGQLLAGGGGESGVLASMVSAQDTVLPARGPDASFWEGRFLDNVVLRTRQGAVDVIGLLREGSALLLLFGDGGAGGGYAGQARRWAGLVRVVHAEPVPRLACDALLVRPDGYVAWASGAGGLAAALTECFGRGAAPARERGVLAGVAG